MYGCTERLYGISEHMNILAQLVCSRVRAEVFRLLFGISSVPLHLRDLQRQAGFSVGTVRQDVEKLVKLGLVSRRKDGNRVYYSANETHPLFPDIRSLVLKTSGLTEVLRKALMPAGSNATRSNTIMPAG